MKLIGILTVVGAVFLSTNVYAETWNVTEGPEHEWQGVWTFSATQKPFSCSQKHPNGTALTAECTVIKEGRYVAVRKDKMSGSTANPCNYFGIKEGDRISGTYFCNSGGPYSWSAIVSR